MAELVNGINNVNQTNETAIKETASDIEKTEKTEETKKIIDVNIPDEKKEKRIVAQSKEGDTLSISETGENYYKLKEAVKEIKPILPEIKDVPKSDTSSEITDTTNVTDSVSDSSSSENLSRYSQDQLKRMLDRGEITTSEYNMELAQRKAQGTLDDAEEKILETEEKLNEIEETNGQGIENLVNGKYGAQK